MFPAFRFPETRGPEGMHHAWAGSCSGAPVWSGIRAVASVAQGSLVEAAAPAPTHEGAERRRRPLALGPGAWPRV